ncbi:MAG TPA: hypothetical protein VIH57_20735 [Bacteroidales bacterium]
MKKHFFENQRNSVMNSQNFFYVFIFIVLLLTSCKKELTVPKDSIAVKGSKDAIIPLDFNWEGTDPNFNWMPQPPGMTPIPLVWTGPSDIDPDIIKDCKKSDGWFLVYNTFTYDPSNFSYNPYYVLYNRYRGIMRIFLYVNSVSGVAGSTYLQDGIDLKTTSYSLLNFAGAEVVDASKNQSRFDKAEPKPVTGPPFANFKWYMLQYEFAYDPKLVATTDAHPPQFWFYVNGVDISNVNLGGTQKGTLNGTIGSSGSTNMISKIISTVAPTAGILAAVGTNYIDKHKGDPDGGNCSTCQPAGSNDLGIPISTFDAISKGLSSAVSSGVSSIPGTVFNLLSAIIGGSSASSQQQVSLNLSTQINLTGSMTSSFSFPSSPMPNYLPGTLKANTDGSYNVVGYVPSYNAPLGVFNISNTPTVTLNYMCNFDGVRYVQVYTYTLDNNSFSIQWNPEVLNNATILSLTKEVVIRTNSNDISSYLIHQTGRVETIKGTPYWWTGSNGFQAVYFTRDTYKPVHFGGEIYLRISFVVHPNNGAPDVAIVKTFNVNQQIINPTY